MCEKIRNKLFELQDIGYKDFQCKLMPTVDPGTVIGVRTPELRKFARALRSTEGAAVFLECLPHRYYEENNLHAFLVAQIKDYDSCINELNRLLPYVDNWATCDSIRPACFKSNRDRLLSEISVWLESEQTYTVRFGIEMLMTYYLDEHFKPEYLETVSDIRSNEYYINMMIAWYFATALAKQWDYAVKFLQENKLSLWVHNKTIQKALESFRISSEQKEYLKQLKQ